MNVKQNYYQVIGRSMTESPTRKKKVRERCRNSMICRKEEDYQNSGRMRREIKVISVWYWIPNVISLGNVMKIYIKHSSKCITQQTNESNKKIMLKVGIPHVLILSLAIN